MTERADEQGLLAALRAERERAEKLRELALEWESTAKQAPQDWAGDIEARTLRACAADLRAALSGVYAEGKTATERLAEFVTDHEITRAGRVLDWIGVAGGMPVSERVKWLAVELACKQGYARDEAEALANRAAGANLVAEALEDAQGRGSRDG